ncbi:ATP-binding cassette sub-family A member 3, partial [Orchesella cincta]
NILKMGDSLKKFGLLLWKNYILQKRHKVQTAVEIILPLFFTLILVAIRGIVTSETKEISLYPEFNPQNPNGTVVWRGRYILYAPNTTHVIELMDSVEAEFKAVQKNYTFVGYESESDLVTDYTNNQYEYTNYVGPADRRDINRNPVLAAVVFRKYEKDDPDINYAIRFPASKHNSTETQAFGLKPRWMTELLYSVFSVPGPRDQIDFDQELYYHVNQARQRGGEPGYWQEGFLYLQSKIDMAIAKIAAPTQAAVLDEFDVRLSRYPYPSYIDDVFVVALQSQLPLFLVLSFIYPIINISKSIVHEKERRLKESMKMMGLPNWLHYSAWFTKSFIFLLISTILMTIFYKVKWYGDGLAVLTYSDGSLLFIFFLAYLFSVITLGFLVSSFFSTANSASTASGVLFFLTYFPYFFLQPRYDQLAKSTKIGMSIFSNTGMAFGCQIITMFEGTGAGIQWSTLTSGASPDDNLSLLDVIIMLFFDGKWYWCGTGRSVDSEIIGPPIDDHYKKYSHLFEKEPRSRAGIKIAGLTKIFGDKIAVNNLHLNFYENQVTALLGHNGTKPIRITKRAGKTTTMSMLTGLLPPTSGTASVNGFDIRNEIDSVRQSLGICPQHDILFDEMTVEEHLKFFCLLKGHDSDFVQSEVDRMITAMGLENKRHSQSQTLSGGMKRKLSVGIALVGGSQVVLLDEPTSGMDPGARRSTWDLITSEKKNRTIVLSTHFMDEADLLGDRIGGGYHLIIVKQPHCQVECITQLLQKTIPEVEVDQNIGAELSYSLPDEKSYMFPAMFEELEERKVELGVASYGCSITQMEEVFMRVGKQVEDEMNRKKSEMLGTKAAPVKVSMETLQTGSNFRLHQSEDERSEGFQLFTQQLWAMIVKKWLYGIRNKLLLITQIVVPVAFLLIALVMLKTLPDVNIPIERPLDLSKYTQMGRPVTALDCKNGFTEICNVYRTVSEEQSTVQDTGDSNFTQFILAESEKNQPRVNFQYIVGMRAAENASTSKIDMVGYFNNQPFHAPPVALNLISTALIRHVTKNDKYKLTMSNHPLPFTADDTLDNLGNAQSEGFTVGFNVAFGMSFLAASFVVFLIKERETKSKHLQYVSGVPFPIFWLAHFLFDVANYLIPCFALMIVLVAFQTEDFKGGEMQGYFLLVLVMYGFAVMPLMYLFSFLFTVPSSGYTRMTFFNFLTGMATILAITILQIEELELTNVADALEWVFMFFPNFDVGFALSQLSMNKQVQKACELIGRSMCDQDPDMVCCTKYPVGYLSWKAPGIGRNLLFMFIVGVLCFSILFVIESKLIEKILYRNEAKKYKGGKKDEERDPMAHEDSDVGRPEVGKRNWAIPTLSTPSFTNRITWDLTKYYDKFLAVDHLCLGVQQGECFGLLGVNGAGKTTTFKMLTGDIPITDGDAFIDTKSVKTDIKKVQRVLGYCPQFDALIPELTGRETIRLFARLRGVAEEKIDHLVDVLGANLLFTEHMEKPCGTYSGGNKRKLSTALALVGNPPIVFLDEPTTGMDPVARRHLWNTISNIREAGTSVVLTSHSMEECEALCTRLAIMVNGRFRCLGATQHLKNKFGDGYTLIAQIESTREERVTRTSVELGRRHSSLRGKLQPWEQDLQPMRNFIERNFPGCTLKDVHPGYVHYHIPDEGVTWGQMFKKMEEAKALFRLEAYSVGQTSLEQVFLSFTKGQVNNDDD